MARGTKVYVAGIRVSAREPTNRPYAIPRSRGSSRGLTTASTGKRYLAVMPANLYGPGDHYDLETS
jgi:GDP-L-fucose synthase